jgi:hypothetical protein
LPGAEFARGAALAGHSGLRVSFARLDSQAGDATDVVAHPTWLIGALGVGEIQNAGVPQCLHDVFGRPVSALNVQGALGGDA